MPTEVGKTCLLPVDGRGRCLASGVATIVDTLLQVSGGLGVLLGGGMSIQEVYGLRMYGSRGSRWPRSFRERKHEWHSN